MSLRLRSLALLVGLACSGRGAPVAEPDDPDDEDAGSACKEITADDLTQAEMLDLGGHLHRALALAEAADRRCSSAGSRWMIADLLADLGLDARAIAAYERFTREARTPRGRSAAEEKIAELRKRPPPARPGASDEDRSTALLLYRDGVNLRLGGKPDDAILQLRRSYVLSPHPLTIVQIAMAHEDAGRAVEARKTYERALAITELLIGKRPVARLLRGHVARIQGLAWSRDGKRIVTAADDQTVKVWEAATARVLHTFPFPSPNDVGISVDGDLIAAASRGGVVAAWDGVSGEPIGSFDQRFADWRATVDVGTSDKDYIVGAGGEGTGARVWAATELARGGGGQQIAAGRSYAGAVLGWSDRALVLLRGSWLEIWSPPGPASGPALALEHDARVGDVAFGPFPQLAAIDGNGAVTLWDGQVGRKLRQVTTDHRLFDVDWSADGTTLAVAARDRIRILDPATLVQRAEVTTAAGWVALSPDGATVASASVSPQVQLWDVGSGNLVRTLGSPVDPVTGVGFGAGGRLLVAARGSGTAELWRLDAVRAPRGVEVSREPVKSLVVDPAGRWLVGSGASGLAHMVSTSSGAVTHQWFRASGQLAVNAAGDRIASVAESRVQLHDSEGRLVRGTTWNDARAWAAVAFSPDGARLALGGTPYLVIKKIGGADLYEASVPSPVTALAWPPGELIAAGHEDGHLRLWSTDGQAPPRDLGAHEGAVHALATSPDGRLLASAGADGKVILWDLRTGTRARQVAHAAAARSAAFTPDGRLLATGGDDGVVLLWEVASGARLATLYVTGEQWLVLAEDGRIDGAAGRTGGAGLIYWQVGATTLPGVTGWDRAHTPGLLRELVRPPATGR